MDLRYILAAIALMPFCLALPKALGQSGHNDKATTSKAACSLPGAWLSGLDGAEVSRNTLFQGLAKRPFVLLGETHTDVAHHRWQLHTLSALLGHTKKLAIGFEMFPRKAQPVLDRWVTGELSESAFLEQTNWRRVWGYDAELYMPLFRFARMHRVPMIALNVDKELISRVGSGGWASVPVEQRQGLGDPAPPSSAYRRAIAEVLRAKIAMMPGQFGGKALAPSAAKPASQPSLDEVMEMAYFPRFVEAQLVWDRAMAERLYEVKKAYPEATIVGVMGSGHLSYRHGVPHQLADLGEPEAAVLIPTDVTKACALSGRGYADLLFTVAAADATDKPKKRLRLGITMAVRDGAVTAKKIAPGSIAEAAGLREGDRILSAAGVKITTAAAMISVIERQTPGFWLPLIVERSGKTVELIAKFPAPTEADK